jgi:hypothetical protein
VLTIDLVPDGDALGAENDQQYAFQLGVNAGAAPFTVHTRVLVPFAGLQPTGQMSMGLFIGPGNQSDYIKLVLHPANNGQVRLLKEEGNAPGSPQSAPLQLPGPTYVDLFLEIDPGASPPMLTARYQAPSLPTVSVGTEEVPAAWLTGPLAVGIIATRAATDPPFAATWDFLRVEPTQTAGAQASPPGLAVAAARAPMPAPIDRILPQTPMAAPSFASGLSVDGLLQRTASLLRWSRLGPALPTRETHQQGIHRSPESRRE